MLTPRTKKFLLLLLASSLWLALVYMIIYLSPTAELMVIFSFLFFSAMLVSLTIAFGFGRRIFFISLGLAVYLLLRFFDMAHLLNVLLLIAILVTIEIIAREQ